MTTLKDRKRQATRAAILLAARTLFEKNGFDKTSVDELAAQALISKFTFYNFFSSKEELLYELHLSVFQELNPDVSELEAKGTKVADLFLEQIKIISRWYEANKELAKALAENRKLILPNGDEGQCLGYTVALIEYGQSKGEFKATLNPRDVARYIFVLIQGEKREWVDANCSYSLEQRMVDAGRFILIALENT